MAARWVSELRFPESEARQLRIAKTDENFAMRGMFFVSMLTAVKKLVDENAAREVAARAGVPLVDYGSLRKYPMSDFLKLQTTAAQRLSSILGSLEEGVAKTAGEAVDDFFASVGGRTMKLLAGKEPHRLLSAAPNAYPLTATDNGKRHYTRTGDNSADFEFQNDVLGPCHNIGVFVAAFKGACDLTPRIEIEQRDHFNYKFHINW
jgi:uncharacterized protein (TIGR02265 family)